MVAKNFLSFYLRGGGGGGRGGGGGGGGGGEGARGGGGGGGGGGFVFHATRNMSHGSGNCCNKIYCSFTDRVKEA